GSSPGGLPEPIDPPPGRTPGALQTLSHPTLQAPSRVAENACAVFGKSILRLETGRRRKSNRFSSLFSIDAALPGRSSGQSRCAALPVACLLRRVRGRV